MGIGYGSESVMVKRTHAVGVIRELFNEAVSTILYSGSSQPGARDHHCALLISDSAL
jgi:hypothetical protein